MPEHSQLTGSSLHEPKGVASASSGQVYIADGAGSGTWTTVTITAGETTINNQTGSTYTLVLTDKGKTVEMDNASANELFIPANASVAFATNSWINIVRQGAGVTTITANTGVTLNGVLEGSCTIPAQYGGVSLRKRDTNNWGIVGLHTTVA